MTGARDTWQKLSKGRHIVMRFMSDYSHFGFARKSQLTRVGFDERFLYLLRHPYKQVVLVRY